MLSNVGQVVLMGIVMYLGLILIPQIYEKFTKEKEKKETFKTQTSICPHMLQFT